MPGRILIVAAVLATTAASQEQTRLTIQQRIDRAKPGAVLEIPAGRYDETLRIDKAVTLRGMGWDKTVIRSKSTLPLVTITSKGVVLERLQVFSTLPGADNATSSESVVRVEGGVRIQGCVLGGGPGNGLGCEDGSEVTVKRSLFAMTHGSGLMARQGKKGRVYVVDSEFRRCRYTGARIGRDANQTTIERCRISGASWHGVRYDHCAPQLIGNLFFGNERTAIYGSGATRATVTQNLFLGMPLSCWFDNEDTISRNTFVGRLAGVWVLRQSRPVLRQNVFHGCKLAIRTNGRAKVTGSVFSANERDIQFSGSTEEPKLFTEELGNVAADPRFRDPKKRDYSFVQGSPALKLSAGAPRHIALQSEWPLLDVERARVAELEAAAKQKAAAELARAQARAVWHKRADAMKVVKLIRQKDIAARQKQGWQQVEKWLASDQLTDHGAGLMALCWCSNHDVPNAKLIERVRALASSDAVDVRFLARSALVGVAPDKAAVTALVAAFRACSTDRLQQLASYLPRLRDRKITATVEPVYLAMLEDTKDDVRRRVCFGLLRDLHVTPNIEARLLALCKQGQRIRGQVHHFVLTAIPNKSGKVLDELLGLPNGTPNYAYLRGKLPAAHRARVVKLLIGLFHGGRGADRAHILRILRVNAVAAEHDAILQMGTRVGSLSVRNREALARLLAKLKKQ